MLCPEGREVWRKTRTRGNDSAGKDTGAAEKHLLRSRSGLLRLGGAGAPFARWLHSKLTISNLEVFQSMFFYVVGLLYQVGKHVFGASSSNNSQYRYVNHCWNCKGRIDSRDPSTPRCHKCRWYRCPACTSCKQGCA